MYKIIRIVAAILSLLGIVFLIRIIAEGDEPIKAAAINGDTAIVDPMAWVTYAIFALTLAFVLFFVLKNLFTDTGSLKNTLIGIGAFAAVLVIAYVLSNGSDSGNYMYNGAPATVAESRVAGAGLIAFYILIVAAAASMVWAGVKKMTT